MGFDFTLIVPLLPSHCGFSFVFGCGVSFLVSSSVFLSMTVQQLVVILVFSQEGVRARPSIPSLFLSPLLTNPVLVYRHQWFSHWLHVRITGANFKTYWCLEPTPHRLLWCNWSFINSSEYLCTHTIPLTRGKMALSSSASKDLQTSWIWRQRGNHPQGDLEVGCGRDQLLAKPESFSETHNSLHLQPSAQYGQKRGVPSSALTH